MLCFDCRFFSPCAAKDANQLTKADWDENAEGECRRHPPAVGDLITRAGDQERWFGNFPRVLASEWCGDFRPCQRALKTPSLPTGETVVTDQSMKGQR